MIPVKEVMTRNVITFKEDTPVEEIAQTLTSKHITGAPVVAGDGLVVGIVSEVDVFTKKGSLARDIMSPHVITVSHQAGKDGRPAEPLGRARLFRQDPMDVQRMRAMGARAGAARAVFLVLEHRHPPGASGSWALSLRLGYR